MIWGVFSNIGIGTVAMSDLPRTERQTCNFCGGRGEMAVDMDIGETKMVRCVCQPFKTHPAYEAAVRNADAELRRQNALYVATIKEIREMLSDL